MKITNATKVLITGGASGIGKLMGIYKTMEHFEGRKN
jgi:short-subunit dehydrogenase involved in D-alanine esterification of teichoic acids